jgi:exosortase A-associated hydrolase 2
VIYLHPFAEEMNRARRMAALQARKLTSVGFGVLLLDLYGCGDSAGDFGDARWETWLGDVAAGIAWLQRDMPRRLSLLGLRLGALLAMSVATGCREDLERVVLWQPVLSGTTMVTQLLRVRLAASMGETDAPQESSRDLRLRLERGESLEVAGYEMAPELVRGIEDQDMESIGSTTGLCVHWLELVREESTRLNPKSLCVIEGWREEGARVSEATVIGEPFWTLQETTLAPRLLAATQRIFEEDSV